MNQVALSHRGGKKRLVIYHDASDIIWSGIVTKVTHRELKLPCSDREHPPLDFFSGPLNSVQLEWSILEKGSLRDTQHTEKDTLDLSDRGGI